MNEYKEKFFGYFIDDLDVLKATYADVSEDIKKLLDRASEQANMEPKGGNKNDD